MDCPRCAGTPPEGSRYCNSCGLPLAAHPGTPASEVDLWRGAPSVRAFVTPIVLWSLWSAGILVAALLTWRPAAWWGAGMLILGPTIYLTTEVLARRLSVRYSLTSRRLFVEEGFLTRRIQEMDLFRIDDVLIVQSLPQRLADVGDVVLYSTDKDTPQVTLRGIERPMQVKEAIRERAGALRARAVQVMPI